MGEMMSLMTNPKIHKSEWKVAVWLEIDDILAKTTHFYIESVFKRHLSLTDPAT